jgi:chemotaxis signal transduction protein
MMQKINHTTASMQKVLIFAVQTPNVANRQVYFLFSIKQMEDILLGTLVTPVPFSQPYLKGIAQWQDSVVPVVSLEECLGLESSNHQKDTRLIVVRVPRIRGQHGYYRIMVKVVPPIRMLALPIDCGPVSDEWIRARHLVRGVYEWEDKFLVVAHMEKILDGPIDDSRKYNGIIADAILDDLRKTKHV